MIQTQCNNDNNAGNDKTIKISRKKRTHNNEEEEIFGHIVYSPDNLTNPTKMTPDWGILASHDNVPNDDDVYDPYQEDPNRAFSYIDNSKNNVIRTAPDDNNNDNDGYFGKTVTVKPNYFIQVHCGNITRNIRDVICTPRPDAFNPCEDLMGNWFLRITVWFVVIAAVFGNLAVLIVLLSSRFRMTVPKFLMCNLAFADLCMGTYLLLIAAMDLRSIGAYFNYAIDWQEGVGCQIAGFLTVFSSELSIFTLTVITSERWYAITYALHLDKRLKLGMAAKVMAFGWLYSITMATLPLLGISSYSKTSICLPMDISDIEDLAYLVTLLIVNGLAFILICGCYAKIYCTISHGLNPSAARTDLTVAKRMALLVFTDFACWAPIAFFGLTAVAGYPLIDVTDSKILLVFFYPLNSCANPYLYAILTKQYRRDLGILLKRRIKCCGGNNANNKSRNRQRVINSATPTEQKNVQLQNSQSIQCVENLIKVESGLDDINTSKGDGERRLSMLRDPTSSSSNSSKNPKGSPHPLRNSTTKLYITGEQEMLIRRAITANDTSITSLANNDEDDNENVLQEVGPLFCNSHV